MKDALLYFEKTARKSGKRQPAAAPDHPLSELMAL
jgi:hypothetical protein